MMKKLDMSYLINKLNLDIKKFEPIVFDYYRLYLSDKSIIAKEINKSDKMIYYNFIENNNFKKLINIVDYENISIFLFEDKRYKDEELAKALLMFKDLIFLFNKYNISVTLKKNDLLYMKNTSQILDRYFIKLEYFIREIEISNYKDDNSFMILSKYHIVLKAKMILSNIISKIYKLINDNIILNLSIIYKNPYNNFYEKGIYFPNLLKVGFISELCARFYLENNYLNIIDVIKDELKEEFYQYHFCFIVLFTYIINISDCTCDDIKYISKYIEITKAINIFINQFNYLL